MASSTLALSNALSDRTSAAASSAYWIYTSVIVATLSGSCTRRPRPCHRASYCPAGWLTAAHTCHWLSEPTNAFTTDPNPLGERSQCEARLTHPPRQPPADRKRRGSTDASANQERGDDAPPLISVDHGASREFRSWFGAEERETG